MSQPVGTEPIQKPAESGLKQPAVEKPTVSSPTDASVVAPIANAASPTTLPSATVETPDRATTVPVKPPVTTGTGKQIVASTEGTSKWAVGGVHFAIAPPNGLDMVNATLQQYLPPRAQQNAPALANASKLVIELPLGGYFLRLADIADGRGLDTAQFNGFEYLIQAANKPVAIADARINPQTGLVGSVSLGVSGTARRTFPPAVNLGNALNQLTTLDQVKSGSYEIRILSINPPAGIPDAQAADALQTVVLWLKSDTGANDLIFTTGKVSQGTTPTLQPNTLYTTQDLLNAMRSVK
jgi:hypothetical protein